LIRCTWRSILIHSPSRIERHQDSINPSISRSTLIQRRYSLSSLPCSLPVGSSSEYPLVNDSRSVSRVGKSIPSSSASVSLSTLSTCHCQLTYCTKSSHFHIGTPTIGSVLWILTPDIGIHNGNSRLDISRELRILNMSLLSSLFASTLLQLSWRVHTNSTIKFSMTVASSIFNHIGTRFILHIEINESCRRQYNQEPILPFYRE
jgi:hypothetical protein